MNWYQVKDGDPRAFALMKRHYSFQPYKDGRRKIISNPNKYLFVGPGEKLVLLTSDCRALFVWRKFIDKSGQLGINCAVFRNESDTRSSDLILEAEQIALMHWPDVPRHYTYVNPRKIKSKNPGCCFKKAGWEYVGLTKSRSLHILAKDHEIPMAFPL